MKDWSRGIVAETVSIVSFKSQDGLQRSLEAQLLLVKQDSAQW